MKLLFLDIDGVLNTHEPLDPEVLCGRFHPDKVSLLNWVLRETGAKLVISSAWRYLIHRGEMNLQGFEWLLRSHGVMQGRLHGITRKDSYRTVETFNGDCGNWLTENERGSQIADYLTETKKAGHMPSSMISTSAFPPLVTLSCKPGQTSA